MQTIHQYLLDEINNRVREYSNQRPTYIEVHYNNENKNSTDYEGRQLLELLQNADDAAVNSDIKKACIILNAGTNVLTVSNTGVPFTIGGFESILYGSVSEKRQQQHKIGQKGLGFRSVLSWGEEIIINSGDVAVRFSETIARNFLKDLAKKHPKSEAGIKEKSKNYAAVPILSIPEIIQNPDSRDSEFATTITIKLKEGVIGDIEKQLYETINKETLLFLNNLQEISIKAPQKNVIYSKSEVKYKEKILVKEQIFSSTPQEITEETWHIRQTKGTLPAQVITNEGEKKTTDKEYELAIAWKDDLKVESAKKIYSYFRTNIDFDFPALLHGTFHLTSNRETIDDKDPDGHNHILITEKLPEFLVETALQISAATGKDYSALDMLNINFHNCNIPFKKDLEDRLNAEILKRKIFPNVNHEYLGVEDKIVLYDDNYGVSHILHGDDVSDLLLPFPKDSIRDFVIRLLDGKHRNYEFSKFAEIINKRLGFPISDIAKLLYCMLKTVGNDYCDEDDYPEFLLDEKNNPNSCQNLLFTFEQNLPKIPSILNLHFINTKLVSFLHEIYGNADAMCNALTKINIEKYDSKVVIEKIIEHYNKIESPNEKQLIELHQSLFDYYKRGKFENPERKPKCLSKLGTIKSVSDLYFGEEYGCEEYGCKINELVFKFDNGFLIASPKQLGLENEDIRDVYGYLKSLGVSERPKKISENLDEGSNKDYLKFAIDVKKICHPDFKDFSTFENRTNDRRLTVQTIPNLKSILAKNPIENIIVWIGLDNDMKNDMKFNQEPKSSKLSYKKRIQGQRSPDTIYGNRLPNYTRWLISNYECVNTISNKKCSPRICSFDSIITSELSPLVEKPQIDYQCEAIKIAKMSKEEVNLIASLFGISQTIRELSPSVIYGILSGLPEIDTDGNFAKRIYNEILKASESLCESNWSDRDKFIKVGRVLCQKQNRVCYESVSTARHYPTKKLGTVIVKNHPILCIDKKADAETIQKIFGVQSLLVENLQLQDIPPETHQRDNDFQKEIQKFKPYVYLFRQDNKDAEKTLKILQGFEIHLVNRLSVSFSINCEKKVVQYDKYEYFITDGKDKKAYIVYPNDAHLSIRNDINLTSSVQEIFYELLDTKGSDMNLRELFQTDDDNRRNIVKRDFNDDDFERIDRAEECFGITSDSKYDFWRAFAGCCSIQLNNGLNDKLLLQELKDHFSSGYEDVYDAFYKIDYCNLNIRDSLVQIFKLFNRFEISLQDFNSRCSKAIDFESLFSQYFNDRLNESLNHFKILLYDFCSKTPNVREKFKDYIKRYKTLCRTKGENELNYHAERDLHNQVLRLFHIDLSNSSYDEIDFNSMYTDNKNRLVEILAREKIPKEFVNRYFDNNLVKESLLYFEEELQNLAEEISKEYDDIKKHCPDKIYKSKSFKIAGNTFHYDSLKELLTSYMKTYKNDSTCNNLEIQCPDPKSFVHGDVKPGRPFPSRPRHKDEYGCISEYIVYDYLRNNIRNNDSVKWMSSYAKEVGFNEDGEDGDGYDIQYKDDDGETHFVEVKYAPNDSFNISSNEVNKGTEIGNFYEIFLVRDIMQKKIEVICKPFVYKNNESFYKNSRFSIRQDSFILKFKI